MKNKKIKFRVEGVALTALVIVAVILANMFFAALGERFDLKVDFTKDGVFTLSEESKALLSTVNREVEIYYATNERNRNSIYGEILDSFEKESEFITVSEVNVDMDPAFTARYKITGYNNIVVVSIDKDGIEKVRVVDNDLIDYVKVEEQRITRATNHLEGYVAAAIRYVTSDDPLKVVIASGHGELMENSECLDYVMNTIYKEGITPQYIDFSTKEIPEGTDVLMFISPSVDFTDSEIKKLDDYFEKGGRVQFYSNPTASLKNINNYFEENWGIRINSDCVSDDDTGYIANTPVESYLMTVMQNHPMTDYFVRTGADIRVINGECNSIEISEKSGVEATALITTSENGVSMSREAWHAKNAREYYEVDKKDHLNLCVYMRKNPLYSEDTTARLLVAGSADIILDGFFDETSDYGNKDLAIKSINYMSGVEDAPISVAGKNVIKEKMQRFEVKELVFMIAGLAGAIPVIMFGIGIVVYVRRRRL